MEEGCPIEEGYLMEEGCPIEEGYLMEEGCPMEKGYLMEEGCPMEKGYLMEEGYLETRTSLKIASFDLDGTLVNPTGDKHPNSVILSREAIQSIIVLRKIHQYKVVIFSNQTSVSSPLYDCAHVERNKLPLLFSKMAKLAETLRYFYALYGSDLGVQLNRDTYPSMEGRRGRGPPADTPIIGAAQRNNFPVSAFFAVGKGNIEALDMYPKPSEGQYCLFICLEGVKYALLVMSYFAKRHRTLLEREVIRQKDKPLGDFLQLVLDMLSNDYLRALVKKLRRGFFHLKKVSLLVLDVYINGLLQKMESYTRFGRDHPGYAAHVEFFLRDVEWGRYVGNDSEGGEGDGDDRTDPVGAPPSPELLRDDVFLSHLTRCLARKNEIMKRLAATFSSVLLNSQESFYAGDNVGRDFDKSDVDLQFAVRAGMRLLDDGQVRELGSPKQ
ncbi:hypothetical protein C922_02576 [Plasmodium inui San Antonio 1]|uniref:Phosphatase n=1 Tax=Plasmodium inui San Antonio 1 TaxID=1237626 RepID=W7A1A6_9APIC|nr:hypothetical protein C922_02576 [Plasmodium inui San Antonio 1]EUD66992.1 hypothetical protein C922_02576 [Plasmodium inui San Antonio 1]